MTEKIKLSQRDQCLMCGQKRSDLEKAKEMLLECDQEMKKFQIQLEENCNLLTEVLQCMKGPIIKTDILVKIKAYLNKRSN